MKEISIVIPVYNKEKYIYNLIKSVLNQTFTKFELILVNDGSTDKSMIIAEQLLNNTKLDYRIINKDNSGQSSARNLGIKEAKCKWIVMPDADDFLQKDYLKIMYQNIRDDVDLVICDSNSVTDNNIDSESRHTGIIEEKSGKDFFVDFIMHNISIGPCQIMFNVNIIKENNIYFDEKMRYSEEFLFINDILYNSKKVIHVKDKLYNICVRKGSVSTNAGMERIVDSYNRIKQYSKKYEEKQNEYDIIYDKYAVSRWVLATARFNTSNMYYSQYKLLMEKIEAKAQIRRLLSFPKFKVKIAAFIFEFSLPLFYKLMK